MGNVTVMGYQMIGVCLAVIIMYKLLCLTCVLIHLGKTYNNIQRKQAVKLPGTLGNPGKIIREVK